MYNATNRKGLAKSTSADLVARGFVAGKVATNPRPANLLTFDDFLKAIAFVNRVAELAQSEDHHPDIEIHYNRVILRWWTHTADGVTDRDRELAELSSALTSAK